LVRKLYRVAAPFLRSILSQLRVVTAVSETAASAIHPLTRQVVLVPNAVDTGYFSLEVERRPQRVVFLGRDEPRKGLDVLLAAWPTVREAVKDAELVVLGVDRGAPDRGIRYLGSTSGIEKRTQLAGAMVFCAPNLRGESFGITLVEAMAAGCAPVVSDLSAFRQVAGEVARYAPVADPDRLAFQLIAALRDRTETEMRGRAAQAAAARFDWQHVLPMYLDLYRQAAG
jgi:phosphatidylinositol alpha-mannosyltransferase